MLSDQPASSQVCQPMREKYWAELDDAGKIERLHEVVKRLMRQHEQTAKTASDARIIAEAHQHASDGTALMPVDSFNRDRQGAELGSRRDEKYF